MGDEIANGFFRALHLLFPAAIGGAVWGIGVRVGAESKSLWKPLRNCFVGTCVAAFVFSVGNDKPYKIFTTTFLFVAVSLAVGIASGIERRR